MKSDKVIPAPEKVWNAVRSFVEHEAKKCNRGQLAIYPIPSSSLGIDTGDYPRVSVHIEMDRSTRSIMFESSTQASPDAPARMSQGFFVPSEDSPWIYESRSGEILRLGEIVKLIFQMFEETY